MNLDIQDGIYLIAKAVEKNEEDKAWQMWLAKYPNMNKESFIPFSEFYKTAINRSAKKEVTHRPKEEILSEIDKIRKQFDSPLPKS